MPDKHNKSTASDLESEMMHKAVKEAADAKDPVEKLRLLCLAQGAAGILKFGRLFRRMDPRGTKHWNYHEFSKVIKDAGFNLDDHSLKEIFHQLDSKRSGVITLNDLIAAVTPTMSESRMKSIQDAYNKLDKVSAGVITVNDLKGVYSVLKNPHYCSGEDSEKMISDIFMAHFELGNKEGTITKEEFFNYFYGISAAIDTDVYFDLTMRQAFKL